MLATGEFQYKTITLLEEQGVVVRGVAQGQDKLHTKQDILLEQLSRLVELLTPEEKQPREGLSVPELLEEIVAQMQLQNRQLKDVSDAVVRAVDRIPALILEALKAERDA